MRLDFPHPAFFVDEMIRTVVNITGLMRHRDKILKDKSLNDDILTAWELIYRAFTRQEFYKNSRGGGDWAPLRPSTLRRRRGRGVNAAILRDTGALFASVQPTSGGLLKSTRGQLRFTAVLSNTTQLGRIAQYHQEGNRRLPIRLILRSPPVRIIRKMMEVGKQLLRKHGYTI